MNSTKARLCGYFIGLLNLVTDNQLTFVKLPVNLKGSAMANIGDNLFIMGGQLPNKEVSKDVYIYTISRL